MSQSQSQSWLQTLGIDVICYITQFLSQDELRIFMQLNRSCAQLLEQRHQAYYQPPLPSFHREEFNLNTYRKWLINRQFLVITSPEQLLAYSRNRIMTYATDVELRVDEYCVNPHSTPKSAASIPRLPLETRLVQLHSAIERFRHVRSVRLVFRPSNFDHDRAYAHCPCEAEVSRKEVAFQQWILTIAEMCLEVWASKLISFEVEWDSHYRCSLPIRLNAPFAFLPRMNVLQHLGIFIRSAFGLPPYLPQSVSAFQFPDEDRSLFIFEGVCQYQQNEEGKIIYPITFTNASHVVWIRAPGFIPTVSEYLDHTASQLLMHDANTGPIEDHLKPIRPIISLQRHQLRSLFCYPLNMTERQAVLKYLATTAFSLESLAILENWIPVDGRHLPSTYAHHLHPLRTSLRILKLTFNILDLKLVTTSGIEEDAPVESTSQLITAMCHGCNLAPIPTGQRWSCTVCKLFHLCELCHQSSLFFHCGHEMIQINEDHLYRTVIPPLPLTLISASSANPNTCRLNTDPLEWARLESFELRFGLWEGALQPDKPTFPPMMRETWRALDRTLPALESLGLSVGLLPLGVEPLSGILLRIKHLTLFDMNHCLVPRTINPRTFGHYLSSALTIIATQLRQLESIHLDLNGFGPENSGDWNEFSIVDCLLPIVLSSGNLRSMSVPAILMPSSQWELKDFERANQNHLFRVYAIWQLLQPSFEPPLNYTSIHTLIYPLLAPIWRSRYDMEFIRMQSEIDLIHPPPNRFSRVTALIQTKLSDWRSKWSEWIKGDALARERDMKRLELIHTRTNPLQLIVDRLRTRMVQLFQQHPQLTPQPRAFAFNLEPINFDHPPELK